MRCILFAAVLLLSLFRPDLATAGSRVRNGGSAIRCEGRLPEVVDFSLVKDQEFPQLENRNWFIERVLLLIEPSPFRELLRERWDQYGNSESWPEGDASEARVHHYAFRDGPLWFDSAGTIPTPDPACDRVLLSYFGDEDPQPFKVTSHYAMLSRFQKNVLELHESVYRIARDLGWTSMPEPPGEDEEFSELANYLQWLNLTGLPREVPDSLVHAVVSALLIDSADSDRQLRAEIRRFWIWSRAIYGNALPPTFTASETPLKQSRFP